MRLDGRKKNCRLSAIENNTRKLVDFICIFNRPYVNPQNPLFFIRNALKTWYDNTLTRNLMRNPMWNDMSRECNNKIHSWDMAKTIRGRHAKAPTTESLIRNGAAK